MQAERYAVLAICILCFCGFAVCGHPFTLTSHSMRERMRQWNRTVNSNARFLFSGLMAQLASIRFPLPPRWSSNKHSQIITQLPILPHNHLFPSHKILHNLLKKPTVQIVIFNLIKSLVVLGNPTSSIFVYKFRSGTSCSESLLRATLLARASSLCFPWSTMGDVSIESWSEKKEWKKFTYAANINLSNSCSFSILSSIDSA